ncbi:hypothetical protein [Synechocystis sp. PCC 7509]|nr:hypothetical protein [Synechocystis sp. PCC 7509]
MSFFLIGFDSTFGFFRVRRSSYRIASLSHLPANTLSSPAINNVV